MTTQPSKHLLREMAYARSGDKGSSANIGIIAYDAKGFEYLLEHLTQTWCRTILNL